MDDHCQAGQRLRRVVVQWVERRPVTPEAAGSSPVDPATSPDVAPHTLTRDLTFF